jgi:hypothetical protein
VGRRKLGSWRGNRGGGEGSKKVDGSSGDWRGREGERDRPVTDLVSGVKSVFIQKQWVRERERMYLSLFFCKEETVFIS